ncbi:MAG: enoyl-CoA hydratase/isomerase family protein [Acidobacteriota bacterium]
MTEYAVADGVARVTLDRPAKRNALNPELLVSLRKALDAAAADASVRVILLRGAGKDFCAGLDLKALTQSNEVLDHFAAAKALADLYLAMRRHPKPIVAAVQGRAIGGGCGLATASDLVIATESSEFRYPEVNMGFIAAIVLSLLRRNVGEKRAFEIVALGEPIPAATALSLGLVNHVYPDAEFDSRVEAYVAALAAKSASALALTKDIFYHIDGMSFEAAIHAGVQANALARMTPDAIQGFHQFVGKS